MKQEIGLQACRCVDEEQDTWEITEGLKETDYIVWPDGECKEGAAVQKNENVQAGGMEEGE